MTLEEIKKERLEKVKQLNLNLSNTIKYYNLYDLFDNLVDYNENDERTVENFLNHWKTKKVFDYVNKRYDDYNEHIIKGEYIVVADDLAVCCALMFIDTEKYMNELITTSNINLDTEMFNYYIENTFDYNLMYSFASEEEEDAWNEYVNQKLNVENVDVDDIYNDNNLNNWLENYRKEHKNENK